MDLSDENLLAVFEQLDYDGHGVIALEKLLDYARNMGVVVRRDVTRRRRRGLHGHAH